MNNNTSEQKVANPTTTTTASDASSTMAATNTQALTLEQATEAMKSLLTKIKEKDAQKKLKEAQKYAAGDLGMIMQTVLPLLFEIQGHVMEKYGFQPSDEGFTDFARCLSTHETNLEFAVLANEFKTIMKSYTQVPSTTTTTTKRRK